MKINHEHEKYLYHGVGEGDQYHDLPWHLNEMLKEIADETDKDMIGQNINTYYEALNTFLIKHSEHPRMSESQD